MCPKFRKITTREKYVCVLMLNVPVNNCSVMSGRSHRFMGSLLPVLFGKYTCLCLRTQHGGGRYRTPDCSLRSQTLPLGHRAPREKDVTMSWRLHWSCHLDHLSFVVRKPVFGISDQVRHKPGCTTTQDG